MPSAPVTFKSRQYDVDVGDMVGAGESEETHRGQSDIIIIANVQSRIPLSQTAMVDELTTNCLTVVPYA